MTIAEGSGVSLRYKAYASGTMVANTEADLTTDPGTTGGQVLRYTQSSLNLKVNSTKSAEILPSRQLRSSRRTSRHVEGSVQGELSPATYFDFFEAILRGTRASAAGGVGGTFTGTYTVDSVTLGAAGTGYTVGDVLTLATSGSATVTVATITGGGGTGPVGTVTVSSAGTGITALGTTRAVTGGTGTGATFTPKWKLASVASSGGSGYTVGDTLIFTGFTATGTPTAHISVATSGAATTTVVDTAGSGITVLGTIDASNGWSVIAPASGHVRRKFLIERYNTDLDMSRLYTECRATGFRLNVPAEGNSTVEIMFLGRNRSTKLTSSAPYLTAPADATTTEVCNSLSGSISINGTAVGLVTAASINCATASEAPAVLGQQFPPDVLLGTTSVDGSFTFLLDDADTAASIFENETEVAIKLVLTNATVAGDSITIDLPRVKFNTADEDVRGDLSQPVTCSFQALEALSGGILSTIKISDTAV